MSKASREFKGRNGGYPYNVPKKYLSLKRYRRLRRIIRYGKKSAIKRMKEFHSLSEEKLSSIRRNLERRRKNEPKR